MASKPRVICFKFEHPVPFLQAWRWQRQWQEYLITDHNAPGAIWFLQHPTCYTLGRSSNLNLLHFNLSNPPAPLYRIDRGGEVTYHSYGQLMIYLTINLQYYTPDLHFYIRTLEQVVIDTFNSINLNGYRVKGLTGVWLQEKKIAAIGVGVKNWITQHGIAINITCNLDGFDLITPCGLNPHSVGRLGDWIPSINQNEVQCLFQEALAKNLYLDLRSPTFDEKLTR